MPNAVIAHPALLTKQRLARELSVSTRTLNRWMKEGMPFIRLPNGHPRFARDAVDGWLYADHAERFRVQASASYYALQRTAWMDHVRYSVGPRIGDAHASLDVFVEGREYRDEAQARAAWEAAMRASIPDAGASRCHHPDDPTGPGRYVAYMAFSREAWGKLLPLIQGGKPWAPEDEFVEFLVRRRVKAALAGVGTYVERGAR